MEFEIVSNFGFRYSNFVLVLPFDTYLVESACPSVDAFTVDAEYREVTIEKRPYSLEVGIFKDIAELNL